MTPLEAEAVRRMHDRNAGRKATPRKVSEAAVGNGFASMDPRIEEDFEAVLTQTMGAIETNRASTWTRETLLAHLHATDPLFTKRRTALASMYGTLSDGSATPTRGCVGPETRPPPLASPYGLLTMEACTEIQRVDRHARFEAHMFMPFRRWKAAVSPEVQLAPADFVAQLADHPLPLGYGRSIADLVWHMETEHNMTLFEVHVVRNPLPPWLAEEMRGEWGVLGPQLPTVHCALALVTLDFVVDDKMRFLLRLVYGVFEAPPNRPEALAPLEAILTSHETLRRVFAISEQRAVADVGDATDRGTCTIARHQYAQLTPDHRLALGSLRLNFIRHYYVTPSEDLAVDKRRFDHRHLVAHNEDAT